MASRTLTNLAKTKVLYNLTPPCRHAILTVIALTQKQLLANLAEKASKTTGLSLGLVGAIEEGIELQDLK